MRRLNILTWHTHGSYLYYLTQAPHQFYVLSKPGRPPGYGGRCGHMPWGDNVIDMPAAELPGRQFDCIVFQDDAQHQQDQYALLSAAQRAWPNAAAYHASKWGLLGLSHALHAELRPHNIKVTAVIAGGMRTPFLLDRFPDIDLATLQDPMNVAQALKSVLLLPDASVVAEITVLPLGETSWP